MQSKSTSDFTTTALRLLRQAGTAVWRAAKLTGRWLEWLFVDRLMRMAVDSYDRRHGRRPVNTLHTADNATDKLREELTRIQTERDELAARERKWQQHAGDAESKAATLHQECDRLAATLGMTQNENTALRNELARLSSIEADYNHLATTAASTSMLLYAEADASEPRLRKATAQPVHSTQYVLTTLPGNPAEATFRIYEKADQASIIAHRSVALLACDVRSIAAAPTHIVNIEPGKASLESGTWRVTKKAVIHLK